MDWITGRPNTVKVKRSLFKNWVAPHLHPNGDNLDEVVRLWTANLEPNTVKSLLYLAKAWIQRESGVALNIRPHISLVGRSKQDLPIRTLSKSEIASLKRTCKAEDPDLYFAIMLSLHTGMRRGEVFGLQYGDIDLLKGRITISRSFDGPCKSGKSRVVPISYELEKELVAKIGLKSYNSVGSKQRTDKIMPVTFDPNPRLKSICKKAGLRDDWTFHTLRHTFATMALEAGRSPKLVSKVLGHASLSTTLDIYWNVVGETLDLGFLDEKEV